MPARPDEYRYERKFVVVDRDPRQIEVLVRTHPALFRIQHPPREINNIYLDSPGLVSFERHTDGMPLRAKFRIRWYGDLLGRVERPMLEIKIKNGYVGRKELYRLPDFDFEGRFSRDDLLALIEHADLPDEVRMRITTLRPVLVNRYRRSYWCAAGTTLRLTLDTDLSFHPPTPGSTRFGGPFVDRHNTIVELKFPSGDAPQVATILRGFPFRLEKFSKYVAGMQRLQGLSD